MNPEIHQQYLISVHALDNPIWSALTTAHASLAEGDDLALRYPREINTLASLTVPSAEALGSLANLARPQETVAVLFDALPDLGRPWELVREVELVQMVYKSVEPKVPGITVEVLRFGAADAAEMVELGTLTNPGPIGRRTHEIGYFVGVREQGRLIAMAGERMRFPGYSEVSGVCTHPDFQGRGLAAALTMQVTKRIFDRGETPFLHSRAANERAVKLYERLGFETRRSFQLGILRRA